MKKLAGVLLDTTDDEDELQAWTDSQVEESASSSEFKKRKIGHSSSIEAKKLTTEDYQKIPYEFRQYISQSYLPTDDEFEEDKQPRVSDGVTSSAEDAQRRLSDGVSSLSDDAHRRLSDETTRTTTAGQKISFSVNMDNFGKFTGFEFSTK
jgi:hypothetical protein